MKTQILRLDSHDDFISARDKMGWSQTGRILLVWPDQGQVLYRRLDLTLIQRHSTKLGAQLALVTKDPEVIYQAGKLGIPVYKSIQKAQKAHWRVDHRRRSSAKSLDKYRKHPRPDLESLRQAAHPADPKILSKPGVRLAFFTLGVFALLALVAVMTPAAEIRMKAASETQELILSVRASPEIEDSNLSGAVPARWLKITVEGRDSLPTHGSSSVPQSHASGTVQFTNLTDKTIQIPEGLVVRSLDDTPVRFEVTRSAELPAGVDRTASLPVIALEPGESSNLPAGSLIGIEGPLGASLTATNSRPTRGGIDQVLPTPTDEDRQQLYNQLEASLRKSALEQLQAQLDPGDILYTSTITVSQVIDQSYDPGQDLPSDQLALNLRMEYQVLGTSAEDLNNMSQAALDASLSDGFVPMPDTLKIVNITKPVFNDKQTARWKINASRQIEPKLAPYDAISLIIGIPPGMAAERLAASLPIEGTPVIQMQPSWWPRMPLLPFRIHVSNN